jgi:hypothetical protein
MPFNRKLTRSIAAGAATIAVAVGGYAIIDPGAGNDTPATANAAPQAQPAAQTSQAGHVPQGWSPGTGTIITGAAADQAKAAAIAQYPEGTVNRVLKLSDGSYAVHRIGTSGQHHIFVSPDFKVTGTS